ncbi:hypothetical protein [Saccharothrix violaceirubra]|uniref:Uncharacterized protein n=1 Tax=Saccharothrix violaceirubra TaxID=413306 RepID=A0A7W7WYY2_9PSEU|nr:hypothetical protein [Saccharothrix violaceirubra]MBB4968717.1 hypothetical protein [Saccharothrix violaceirubra]
MVVGALLGVGLGGAWWATREIIASGRVCSTDDWDCLAMALFAIPVSLVVGVVLAWLLLRAVREERALSMAAVGVTITAVLTFMTLWVEVPASGLVAGALGFMIAAPVTARHDVRHTATHD